MNHKINHQIGLWLINEYDIFLLTDTSDSSNVVKFLEEGLIMKTFDHPNVLGLLGLTFDTDGKPLIVLPFMANGDLKTFFKMKQVQQESR